MKSTDALSAIAVAVLWGTGFVVAKAAMSHFPPIFLMALRFVITALCLLWFFRPPWPLMWRIFMVSLVGATIQYSLTFTGLRGIDASTAVILVQLEVPFALMLAWLVFHDRLNRRQLGGIALALVGIACIVGGPRAADSLPYMLMSIGGAFAWAVGQIMVKRLGVVGGLPLITWVSIFAVPQLLLASLLFETGQLTALTTAGPKIWIAVTYLGLGMTTVAYALWYRLLGLYPISRVMPFLLLLPLTTLAGGILFLNETPTLTMLIGAIFVLAGVAVINIRLRTKKLT